MQLQRSEALVLQVTRFRDYDQIVTAFTPENGVIKLVYHGALSSKRQPADPLTCVECVFTLSGGELFSCREFSVLNRYPQLRQNILRLEAACDMAQAIVRSQMLHTPAPALYALLKSYFLHLPVQLQPRLLALSFRVKLLRHEGLLEEELSPWMEKLAYCRSFNELAQLELTPEQYIEVMHLFDTRIV